MSSPAKPTEPATSIEDLPPEMIFELFKYLHVEDVAICSMVNKRWRSIASLKVNRLVVSYGWLSYSNYKWNYPDRRIEKNEQCSPEVFQWLEGNPFLSNLKYLAVLFDNEIFDPNKLNQFPELLHLEVGRLRTEKVTWNLPKLRVLVIRERNFRCPLSIDCPNLEVLRYEERSDASLLDVKHPETIRKLKTNMVGSKLARLKSVECLLTDSFELVDEATLFTLPRLNELHYDQSIPYLLSYVRTLGQMKHKLSEFIADVQWLRGSDFKFTFAGFRLTQTVLEQIDFGAPAEAGRETVSDEYIYMRNHQLIDPDGTLEFIHGVDYKRLLHNATENEEIPSCLLKKFIWLETVRVYGMVPSANRFLSFLKPLNLLKNLHLNCSQLSQEFCDQLPASAPQLVYLEFRSAYQRLRELQLSFDFVGNFSCLLEFYIYYYPLSIESLTSLYRWLGSLELFQFDFRLNGKMFRAEKKSSWMAWKVRDSLTKLEVFETWKAGEIVNYFESLLNTPEADQVAD